MTDMAQEFKVHIKECCVEITVSNGVTDKNSEDNSSDDAADFKFDPANNFSKFLSENGGKLFESSHKMDQKSPSVSLIPLHNSVSYCYPGAANTHGFSEMCPNPGFIGATEELKSLNGAFPPLNGKVNGFGGKLLNGFNGVVDFSKMNGETKHSPSKKSKVEVKAELASPVQSSSDNGIPEDVISGDIACFHCGCEFADTVSLDNHTELYHREEDPSSTLQVQSPHQKTKPTKKPRFSCAVCNFGSDRQRTILEHMRFHTGEVLRCGVCDFTSVCDSTLEEHVAEKHSDGERRCPHCGVLCQQKVPFIRHYRKYHHSKSCSRCRVIKRSLDPKLQTTNEQLNLLLETSKTTGEAEVLPYLHHNPYSRRSNAIGPYSHCHSAMSKVAVAIAPSLQRTAEVELNLANKNSTRLNKNPRKQTKPRKLLNPKSDKEKMPSKGKGKKRAKRKTTNKNSRQGKSCIKQRQIVTRSGQSNCRNMKKKKDSICDTITASIRNVKLLKVPPSRGLCCLVGHGTPIAFRSGASYIRHLFWCHHAKRFRCHLCSARFRHEYQVLLHRRSVHEN
ncbi:hypothetical protein JTE90_009038 [Oedothorax gibbosus]|uniref:C2H2-type domain-containing protein n=1 Tax=Oedothorax gibbosus TaxID=931172 RepID=A0AAV6VK26_9ARAC|nr:hypothetical protein JTE90_009038 [Oedothorax gibbosus]